MTSADAHGRAEAKANELYWGSEMSVNQIAEELDLSKGTLYGMIQPRASGLACPSCAEELVFPNRTARDRGVLACPACDWEGSEDEVHGSGAPDGEPLPVEKADEGGEPGPFLDSRKRTILGGALLGAAAGLALVLWARRR